MGKRHRIVFLLLLTALLASLGFYLASQLEPTYQGRRLSAWLEELNPKPTLTTQVILIPNRSGMATRFPKVNSLPGGMPLSLSPSLPPNLPPGAPVPPAVRAIREIGTEAVPHLLGMLRARDSRTKLKVMEWLAKQSILKLRLVTATESHQRALDGFRALGPLAKPAIPALVELHNDRRTAERAAWALAAIGPDAVLPFAKALTNKDPAVRMDAAMTLGSHFGAAAQPAIPALLHSLKDQDARVRHCAGVALGRIGREPDLVIPALTEHLSATNALSKILTVEALSAFGKDAQAAIPALRQIMEGEFVEVRVHAA